MLTITITGWQKTGDILRGNWRIDDDFGEGIQEVRARIFKEGDNPAFAVVTGTFLEIDVTQYEGVIHLEVEADNFAAVTSSEEGVYSLSNFTPPTQPTFASYRAFTPTGLIFEWGVNDLDPVTSGWIVVNVVDNVETILAQVPVGDREAPVVMDTSTLRRVHIYGIDAQNNRSEPSPALGFSFEAGGPTIYLGALQIAGQRAQASWQIASQDIIKDISWRLTGQSIDVTGKGLPIDSISIDVAGYVGPLVFTLVAIDIQDRRKSETRSLSVYLQAPQPPELIVEEVGLTFVRVRAVPVPGDPVPTEKVLLIGANDQIEVTTPFVHQYEDLRPGTPYAFAGVAINPTGLRSLRGPSIVATTMRLPATPGSGQGSRYYGGPVLPHLHSLLNTDIRHYILQLYTDTRIRNPMDRQIVTPPVGFDSVVDLMRQVGPYFGDILRSETTDEPSYRAALAVDKTGDVIEKLAIYIERLEYGNVWNQA